MTVMTIIRLYFGVVHEHWHPPAIWRLIPSHKDSTPTQSCVCGAPTLGGGTLIDVIDDDRRATARVMGTYRTHRTERQVDDTSLPLST